MITKDKQVVTFSSPDGTMRLVICMDEVDIKHIDEKIATPGTHFVEGWSARVFMITPKGVLVIIPQ